MPTDVIFTDKADTGASDAFDCLGYPNVEIRIWSTEANPDATLEIQAGGTPWFTIGSQDLASTNPGIWAVPSTSAVRVEVTANASGKAVNATITRAKFEGGPG
jgi:hypothetical protein